MQFLSSHLYIMVFKGTEDMAPLEYRNNILSVRGQIEIRDFRGTNGGKPPFAIQKSFLLLARPELGLNRLIEHGNHDS